MDVLLWVIQGLIVVLMLLPGFMKLTSSSEALIQKGNGRMDWVEDVSSSQVKLIGLVEVLAAFGLVLPELLGILPILTPLAAIGVILTMLGAIGLHMKRGDGVSAIGLNVVIILLAAFVAYGRLMPVVA